MPGGNTFDVPNPAIVQLPMAHLLRIAQKVVAIDDSQ